MLLGILAHSSAGRGCRHAALPRPLFISRKESLWSSTHGGNWANCSTPFLAFWVYPSPMAFVSKILRDEISSIAAPDFCLCQNQLSLLSPLFSTTPPPFTQMFGFCLAAPHAADGRRFLTGFELLTDDNREKSLLKKNGTILNHIASFLSLEPSRAGSI